jgi:hypothetical protein
VVEEDILEAEINYCYPHDLKESLKMKKEFSWFIAGISINQFIVL